ncbi:MAG: hypothetical protein HOP09_14675 [Hyphomicrobium sp.]|nr:hypothetical protein [Hyphomicrobium sp.]
MITITVKDTRESLSIAHIRVDYSPEISVTEHPVEFGVSASDHAVVRPLRLTVVGFVSDAIQDGNGALPFPFAVERAVAFLSGAAGKLLELSVPGDATYLSMMLEAYPHSKEIVGGRQFELRFREVRVVTGSVVMIPSRIPAPPAQTGSPLETDLGTQTAAPVETSIIFDITSFLAPTVYVAP